MNVAISRKNSRVRNSGRNSPYAIQRCKMFDEKNDRKRKWTKNLLSYCVNYSVTCHEYFWWRRQSLAEALFRQIPFEQFRMETFHGKDDWSWHLPIAQGCWLRQTHCPRCNVQNPAAAVEYSCKIKVLALLKRKALLHQSIKQTILMWNGVATIIQVFELKVT